MFRTKWKRQTAVGIELLAEAGNVAALQQMYRGLGYPWPLPPSPLSTLDLYYRQAAAAHSLQRPFPYKLLPGCGGGTPLPPSPHHPGLFSPPSLLSASPLPPLSLPAASAALQELSAERARSPCPSPGSPPCGPGQLSPSPLHRRSLTPSSSSPASPPPPHSRRPYSDSPNPR